MTAKQKMYALGRLKTGKMNKTEEAYAQYLELLKRAGEVRWFVFEGIKLKLADKTFLTVDFVVLTKDMVLEMHDVKGSHAVFMDDARVKMKVAAEKFPFIFKIAIPKAKRSGGGWTVDEIGNGN